MPGRSGFRRLLTFIEQEGLFKSLLRVHHETPPGPIFPPPPKPGAKDQREFLARVNRKQHDVPQGEVVIQIVRILKPVGTKSDPTKYKKSVRQPIVQAVLDIESSDRQLSVTTCVQDLLSKAKKLSDQV